LKVVETFEAEGSHPLKVQKKLAATHFKSFKKYTVTRYRKIK